MSQIYHQVTPADAMIRSGGGPMSSADAVPVILCGGSDDRGDAPLASVVV